MNSGAVYVVNIGRGGMVAMVLPLGRDMNPHNSPLEHKSSTVQGRKMDEELDHLEHLSDDGGGGSLVSNSQGRRGRMILDGKGTWWRWVDLNHRLRGYEPRALTN